MSVPAPAVHWPRGAVLGLLAAVAVGMVGLEVARPGWTGWAAPAVVAGVSLVVAVLVARHSLRLDRVPAGPWRAVAVVAGLVAVGESVAAARGVGVNPAATGPQDVPLVAALPFAFLACARLIHSATGRIGSRVVLDSTVALLALGLLLEILLGGALPDTSRSRTDGLLALGYPAVGVLLCAVGLVTLAAVGEARRASAGWLLAGFACVAVISVSGSVAAAAPAVALDVVTGTAWIGLLGAVTLGVAADPGQSGTRGPTAASMPLLGVVVSYCAGFGVVLVLFAGRVAGRSITTVEAAAAALLLLLTFARTLLWATDGARLTRRVVRTESYFRTLVHNAADITLVLDSRGQVTWASTAGRNGRAWTDRDLEGRLLAHSVHPDDQAELARVLDGGVAPDAAVGRVFRLRTREGGWRSLETLGAVSSAALQAPLSGGAAPQVPMPTPEGAGCDGEGLVLHLRDVDERRTNERELERLAYTDFLTGLPNRARLMAAVTSARSRAAEGEPASLLLLDLDGFKTVNDVAGHEAGDLLLVEVAARLRTTVRDRDLVGRLGGDEFAVLVRADLDEATALAERIVVELRGVHRTVRTTGADPALVFDVTASIGVTALDPAEDVPAAFREADLALRAAKAAGKDCVRRHGEGPDSTTGRRTQLARDLPDALSRGQLRLLYQPVVGVLERRVLSVEALLRWDHPLLGEVSPDEFVPLAEDDGLIVPMQRWVLEQATAELAGLLGAGRDLQLAVNVSVRHLQAGCLVPDITAALRRAGLPPHRLMLEVTESLFIGELDRADGDLATLHDLGCVISLDDFGRGFSTFAYLARLPVDVLKMDREFLAGIEDDERSAALVHSVIDLGRRLDIAVVAEGVATTGQLAALRAMGCRYLQGFLLGHPTAPADLPALLDAFDATLLDGGAPFPDRDSPLRDAAAAVRS